MSAAAAPKLLMPKDLHAQMRERLERAALKLDAKLKSEASSEMSSPFAIRALSHFQLTKELASAHEDVKVLREALIKPRKEAPKPAPKPAEPTPKPAAPAAAPAPPKPAAAPAAPATVPKPAAPAPKPAAAPATGGAGVAPAEKPKPKPKPTAASKAEAEALAVSVLYGERRRPDAAAPTFLPEYPRYDDEIPATEEELRKRLAPLLKIVAPYRPRIDAANAAYDALSREYDAATGPGKEKEQLRAKIQIKQDAAREAISAAYDSLPDDIRKLNSRLAALDLFAKEGYSRGMAIAGSRIIRRRLRLRDEGGLSALYDLPLKELRTYISERVGTSEGMKVGGKVGKELIASGALPVLPHKLTREQAIAFLKSGHESIAKEQIN